MKDPFKKDEIKIAVIGGGTGSFTMLSALKAHTSQLAAIVNMVDDGGSTGVLRDELGTLPPGDVRQCLVALSESPKVRDLFSYRFGEGTFSGHSFGNILLTALEKVTGSFSEAIETASDILRVRGVVIPVTLDDVRLKMEWPGTDVMLHGEKTVGVARFAHDPRRAVLSLTPHAKPNPAAIVAIQRADLVVVAPGDLYSSLGPLLSVPGIGDALRRTQALKVYIANLVTKQGHTDGFTVSDYAAEVERLAGGHFLDYVLYNEQQPPKATAKRYKEEGAYLVAADGVVLKSSHYKAVSGSFIGEVAARNKAETLLHRSLIRHDGDAIAKALLKLYRQARDV